MKTKIKCPYCGKENSVLVEDGRYFQKQITTCDLEEGGCDKDFVVETHISINAECKKIEGEEEAYRLERLDKSTPKRMEITESENRCPTCYSTGQDGNSACECCGQALIN